MVSPVSKYHNEKAAINKVFGNYASAYATDVEIAAEFWTEPAIAILPSRMVVLEIRANIVDFLSASRARLQSLNYSHTETNRSEVKMLNSTTALYAVRMNRMSTRNVIVGSWCDIHISER
jgi:hypothetical protein